MAELRKDYKNVLHYDVVVLLFIVITALWIASMAILLTYEHKPSFMLERKTLSDNPVSGYMLL